MILKPIDEKRMKEAAIAAAAAAADASSAPPRQDVLLVRLKLSVYLLPSPRALSIVEGGDALGEEELDIQE